MFSWNFYNNRNINWYSTVEWILFEQSERKNVFESPVISVLHVLFSFIWIETIFFIPYRTMIITSLIPHVEISHTKIHIILLFILK